MTASTSLLMTMFAMYNMTNNINEMCQNLFCVRMSCSTLCNVCLFKSMTGVVKSKLATGGISYIPSPLHISTPPTKYFSYKICTSPSSCANIILSSYIYIFTSFNFSIITELFIKLSNLFKIFINSYPFSSYKISIIDPSSTRFNNS